jgi:hypothetical protein
MLGWDQYGYDKKCIGTRYVELLFLHLVASTGHVVHFGASEERIVDKLFFRLRWDRYGLTECASGHIIPNLCFHIWWDLWAT